MPDYKKILVTGGTGFIGTHLVEELLKQGHFVKILTRNPQKYEEMAKNLTYVGWDDHLAATVAWSDVIFNLAGENIFGKLWTKEVKKRLRNSRIKVTQKLVEAIGKASSKPELFVSVSAAGYYGNQGHKPVDENSRSGDDFLAHLCVDWEATAKEAERYGVRLVVPRLGIVIGRDGGALTTMLPAFKLFVGGPVGSGEQYVPWIHIDDVVKGLTCAIKNERMKGTYNLCAPNPVSMNTFAEAVGRALNRPSFFKIPSFVLKLILGEAATPILASIRCQPQRLLDAGFEFAFEDIYLAVNDVV